MAVVMTTKFYEEDTPAWHDLSKIVFTSPNITSPNTAGIRSHILPGQGNLALWYEDSANMYEIEPIQDTYDTSFYYYHFDVVTDIDLDSNPTSALITFGNYSDLLNFINRELDVEVINFLSTTSNIIDETIRLEYKLKAVSGYEVENIYLTTSTSYTTTGGQIISSKNGWKVEVMSEFPECYIDFEFLEPTNITYMVMEPMYSSAYDVYTGAGSITYIFIGNFKIQGKTVEEGASWVDLYTGSNPYHDDKEIFMTDNTIYYTYYRILILDNLSLYDCNVNMYAISGLAFYGYEYSTDPGTGHIILYSFEDDVNSRELHVTNVASVVGVTTNTKHDTNTDVEGVINISTVSDTTMYSVNVNIVGEGTDYYTQATGASVSPVISGTTGSNGTIGTTSIFQDSGVVVNGYIDVTGETKIEDGYIYSNLSGQQLDITYTNTEYDIITDITYMTVVSGTVVSGTVGDVAVTGYTNRYEDRDSAARNVNYEVSLIDTVGTGTVVAGTTLHLWKQKTDLADVEFSTHDSIVFEITEGEAYDCRLTAWDDVTHSTTLNYLISGDYVRVSALAFRSEGTILEPASSSSPINYIASPIYGRIFKGNVVYNGTNYYYGDFNLSHRTEPDMIGDYLIFKPMLYEIDDTIPYGIHDHVIVFHYTYT